MDVHLLKRLHLVGAQRWNVVHGVIYIANARAHNVARDDDYSAALYRGPNATLSCVMLRQ